MGSQTRFYGSHTELKLKAITAYLESYLAVLSKQDLQTFYIDAFAGSGNLPVEHGGHLLAGIEDAVEIFEGSAVRAAQLHRKFDHYVFIEKSRAKLDELKLNLGVSELPADVFSFVQGDADVELRKLCPKLQQRKSRSVVFLDPFGGQVSWDTLCALAETRHVDLWYLFPAGLCVNRQISSGGTVTLEQERQLDRILGTSGWRQAFVATEIQDDLFGTQPISKKAASIDDMTRFMIGRLKTIFQGGVCEKWLPLGRDGAHWYSLIFAMANPGKSAKRIGQDIAKHIMTNK
jgi:three-Cys-motif partner protein